VNSEKIRVFDHPLRGCPKNKGNSFVIVLNLISPGWMRNLLNAKLIGFLFFPKLLSNTGMRNTDILWTAVC
jgi:hypothetical protein